MPLSHDLQSEVAQIFKESWVRETTTGVPDPENLRLNNHAKLLEAATVLYADLDGSTKMVDTYGWDFCAEMYKAYLRCAARVIKEEGGVITAYDGDRIMAIFTGDRKNTSAVRAAMKINHAVINIIRPAVKAQYPDKNYVMKHVVGVDTSALHAARIGVRGYNDLVWVGRAANYAAKLTAINNDKPLWITAAVYTPMMDEVKFNHGTPMWEKRSWPQMNNMEVYCSSWHYPF